MNSSSVTFVARMLLAGLLAAAAVASARQDAAPSGAADEQAEGDDRGALALEIRGAIGPATSSYLLRGIEKAADEDYRLVLIEMDTPGGLDTSMRDIIKAILASEVPVVTYVTPSGSRAASAGTYILYASHVAAMAPATNLGAATPVQIGGGPPDEPAREPDSGKDRDGAADREADDEPAERDEPTEPAPISPVPTPGSASERKAINDAVAYIRGLAEMRGRNADWAEKAVREAASLSAEQALEMNVIDAVAANRGALLEQIDGMEVTVAGRPQTLQTRDLLVEKLEPDWRTELLAVITDPNVAYLLMLIGIYGLIFEGYNPGALVPGVVGAICLLLALFAFQVLSVNYAGLALIGLGIVLMIAEAFAPSFGVLGIGGLLAFVIGSIILMDTDAPGFGISKPLIGGVALVGGALVLGTIAFAMRARSSPIVSGRESLVGRTAEVADDFSGTGTVRIQGEIWSARSREPVRRGQKVKVVAIDGLTLEVEPDTGTEH